MTYREMSAMPVLSFSAGGVGEERGSMLIKRVATLEQQMSVVQTDLAVIRSNYATKEDVSNAKNSIILWVVSAIFLAQVLPSLLVFVKQLAV